MLTRLTVVLVFAATALAAAAKHPNFSGKWTLNVADSDFGPNYPVPTLRVDTIEHKEPKLKIATREVMQGKEIQGAVEYTTDGKECTNGVMGNPMKSIVQWDGETLWIHTWGKFAGNDITLDDHYSLSKDKKKSLTVIRHFQAAGRSSDQIIVFDK